MGVGERQEAEEAAQREELKALLHSDEEIDNLQTFVHFEQRENDWHNERDARGADSADCRLIAMELSESAEDLSARHLDDRQLFWMLRAVLWELRSQRKI